MKIITIVGIRKSGKTSTVTALVEAISRRGKTAGTCKTVFCPTFSIDKPTANTAKHRQAGSQLVCSRAKNETAFLYPKALPLSSILEAYRNFDYVLLEGDYYAPTARIVCAHSADDALMRQNDLTIAFSGRISEKMEIDLPLPRYNALTDADALLDFIDENVADAQDLSVFDAALPVVAGVSDDGFCQCGCHHHQKQQGKDAVQVTVDGEKISLNAKQIAQIRKWASEAQNG